MVSWHFLIVFVVQAWSKHLKSFSYNKDVFVFYMRFYLSFDMWFSFLLTHTFVISQKLCRTTVVKFGTDVKKVVYNNDGSIKKSVSLGTFKGIDQEANLVFADGDTCTDGSGPNYGRVGIRCGQTTEIAEIIRRSTCRFVIRVNTGEQCAHNYNRYGSDVILLTTFWFYI